MKGIKLTAAVLSAALIASCASRIKDTSETIISVGDYSITENGFAYIYEEYKKQTADPTGAKDKTRSVMIQNLKYAEGAKLLGIEVTDEEISEMRELFVESSGGADSYEQELKDNGIDESFFTNAVFAPNEAYSKLEETVDKSINNEQRKEYFDESYIKAKHILIMTMDQDMNELDDEGKADAKQRAEELYERILTGEDFDELMYTYTEDPGIESSPNGYIFTDGEMVQPFYDGALSIEPNEVTMVQSVYGYHIIKRVPLDENQTEYEQAYDSAEDTLDDGIIRSRIRKMCDDALAENGIEEIVNEELYNGIE